MTITIRFDNNDSGLTERELRQDLKYLVLDYLKRQGVEVIEHRTGSEIQILTATKTI